MKTLHPEDDAQQARLFAVLKGLDGLLVAYSGGVDSAYLAWAARQVLGERMVAVLADSPSLPRAELHAAIAFAETHAISLRVVQTREMESAAYVQNHADRCFHCKDELFAVMERTRSAMGFAHLAYGRNVDDAADFRPSVRAAKERGVLSPLVDAGLEKSAIRRLARAAGLEVWAKPAAACLASRVEYGQPVTTETLRQIEDAEAALHALGFEAVRVRAHGPVGRVEFERADLERAVTMLDAISRCVREAGFAFAAVDCDGYRSGSMNALLPATAIAMAGE